jgi:hypothetical protein
MARAAERAEDRHLWPLLGIGIRFAPSRFVVIAALPVHLLADWLDLEVHLTDGENEALEILAQAQQA